MAKTGDFVNIVILPLWGVQGFLLIISFAFYRNRQSRHYCLSDLNSFTDFRFEPRHESSFYRIYSTAAMSY